jgi:tRNA dimethylallyltransferase
MQVLALVGPTAVGKSAAAAALAGLPGAGRLEIVNADAMQMYRGMDIGTAKVDPATRCEIPHHLLDVWEVGHRASVVEFAAAARASINEILPRALPVVVGGSGLYLTAALDDLQIPPTDPGVRLRYEQRLAELGPAALHAELAARDPAAADAIDPGNGRRIVRALEVVELQGSFAAQLPREARSWRPTCWVGLTAPLPVLDQRIEHRVAAMWDAGLPREVAELAERGLREGPTASRAVGYAECLAYLAGELSREEAMAATVIRTRQLARRQLRWFRRDPRILWLAAEPAETPVQTAQRIDTVLHSAQSGVLAGPRLG